MDVHVAADATALGPLPGSIVGLRAGVLFVAGQLLGKQDAEGDERSATGGTGEMLFRIGGIQQLLHTPLSIDGSTATMDEDMLRLATSVGLRRGMMKLPTHPNAFLHASVALSVLLASCSPRSCEDAESEYYSRLEECEVDFFFDSSDNHVCDDVQRQFVECKISCLDAASCEAVRGEGGKESMAVAACQDYCQAFIFQAIPDEELSK